MVIEQTFWEGRRVFLTGHTGFKGAWMSLVLSRLGAEVYGYALPPDNAAGLFEAAGVANDMHHRLGDVRDFSALRTAVAEARPSIVVHMAAQALVRPSYADPVGTYATNVMGTVHLLEAVRQTPGVEGVVVVTSDKCYENVGWVWGYREADRLGGHDPYSNSKGCAELVAEAYRRSFFSSGGACSVASARAGNVIGGGDWGLDRLVPDAMRAFTAGEVLRIRNPSAVRPWQHVLDPVLAYLLLAERLASADESMAEGWNFGPGPASEVPVRHIVENIIQLWGGSAQWEFDDDCHVHEAAYLKLDCTKAASRLGWRPVLDLANSLRLTVEWYRAQSSGADMRELTMRQIDLVLDRNELPRQAAAE
ncbi:MAG TPA: CDP-glucose 4,6-dehydratase [Afifellaceae bacterium]|nr:CDP-glucose 4,6-dehydratase [Afifellaceae bacterium]